MATIGANSTETGYLRPDPGPEYDQALEDVLQDLIVGLTGLAGNMVRPRYQPKPPGTPEQNVPWAAFSASIEGADWNPVVVSDPNANAGAGEHRLARSEDVGLSVSFYGPGAWALATVMRDGFGVAQNRDAVEAKGLKFVECASLVYAPFQLKDVWVKKTDLKVFFRRWVTRTYGIRNFASADGTIDNERYVTSFSAHQP
jgi:hypothetical protein